MISSGGDFAKALAIRATEEAAAGRPESAALMVAGLNLASLGKPSGVRYTPHQRKSRKGSACENRSLVCFG